MAYHPDLDDPRLSDRKELDLSLERPVYGLGTSRPASRPAEKTSEPTQADSSGEPEQPARNHPLGNNRPR